VISEQELEEQGQLRLPLFPGEPWDGQVPRALTRVHLGLILQPGGVKDERFFLDPDQLSLFTSRKRRRRPSEVSLAAETLLPLPLIGG